jgi:mannose-6-phosphate isomerase-like protein (cupin superfamily)
MHENLNEIYYHVLGGPLGVSLRSDNNEKEYILYPGDSITVPNKVYHKIYAVDNTPPIYYETVLPTNGMHINNNDIHRLKKATPMSGSLTYL